MVEIWLIQHYPHCCRAFYCLHVVIRHPPTAITLFHTFSLIFSTCCQNTIFNNSHPPVVNAPSPRGQDILVLEAHLEHHLISYLMLMFNNKILLYIMTGRHGTVPYVLHEPFQTSRSAYVMHSRVVGFVDSFIHAFFIHSLQV